MKFPHIPPFTQLIKEDIPMVFRIFARDIRNLWRRPVALIIVLGVAFIPSLYAWINIYANWDPYGNTGNLQVAVASKDAGYQVEGVTVNMGDSVIESLRGDENFDWQFTSEAEARDGVESGKYYAAVIIPTSFTEDIVTFITDSTERPAIEYYSNEKKNAIAAKITTTGMGTLRSTINEQFINTVSAAALDVLNITDNMLEKKEDSIMDHLTSSLEKTSQDIDRFSSAVDLLIETAQSAQELTAAAQALLPDTDSTIQDSLTALGSLRALTDASDATASALTDALQSNMDAVVDNVETIYDDLEDAAGDAEGISSDAAAALDRVSSAADSAADAVKRTRAFLAHMEDSLLSMAHRFDTVINDLKNAGLPLPSFSGNLEQKLKQAIDPHLTALDNLRDDLREISRSAGKAADTIRTDGTLPASQLSTLRNHLKTLRSDLNTVKEQYQNTVSPCLDDTLNQFYTCLDDLSGLLVTLNQDLPLIKNVLTGVDGSLEHSIAALQQSGTLLRSAKSDVDSLLSDLNSVEKDERFAKLLDMVREDPDTVADFLASPVELTTKHVYPVENYGSSMTPFYSILAIWVGGLLACSILKTNVKEDEKLRNIPPTVAYFGRYCLFAAVALLQGLIICLGDLFILRIQCLYPLRFIAVGLVAALVYSLMMYTLTVSFKDVGKAIAVVIMIVQVAGAGGTFPVELLPEFFQATNPYMPFTFCINAMRECIGGMYGNNYTTYLLSVSAIYIPISLLIGIVLRRPIIWLMNFFEHQVEKTGLL
ncbi:YhgE/Pip domain-containing protein [bacterium 210917-SL.2.15]|nr:YhgE/Pip domain-containing protein [bacterium 210917-SL.2.15]